MRFQHPLLLLAVLGALLVACRKEQEEEPPSISILSPGDASTLAVPDTLLVTVQVSDDQAVEQVAVSLLNANYIPVTSAVSAPPVSNPATLTLALPVTSEQLESGAYKILATATDGDLSAQDIRAIQVAAAPLRLRAVLVVTEPSPGSVAVQRIDSLGQVSLAGSFNMDLGGAAVSSAAQRLLLAGGATGPLMGLAPDGMAINWQQPNQSPLGQPWFTSMDLGADGVLYVGSDDGRVHGYDAATGSGLVLAELPEGYRAEQSITIGDLLLCSARHEVTQAQRLVLFQRSSGAQQGYLSMAVQPVRLFGRDDQHVLVFGNEDGAGRVIDRDFLGGGSWEAYNWPGPINAVEEVAPGVFVVALANGELQRFSYNTASSMGLGTTDVLSDLAYDPVNGVVYGASSDQVLTLDPATGMALGAQTMGGPVRKVLPLFNR